MERFAAENEGLGSGCEGALGGGRAPYTSRCPTTHDGGGVFFGVNEALRRPPRTAVGGPRVPAASKASGNGGGVFTAALKLAFSDSPSDRRREGRRSKQQRP